MAAESYRVRWLSDGLLEFPGWSPSVDGAKDMAAKAAGVLPLRLESSVVSIVEASGPLNGRPGLYTIHRARRLRFAPSSRELTGEGACER
jgi:hypothetical protein